MPGPCRTSGKSDLFFSLDEQNLTTQEVKQTQDLVDQHLAAHLLPRTVFHSRGDAGSLLEVCTLLLAGLFHSTPAAACRAAAATC